MKRKIVPVRMEEELVARLDERRKELKARGRSELVREAICLFMQSGQPELKRELIREFNEWRRVLRGVGSNLNQIAARMHSNSMPESQALDLLNDLNSDFKSVAESLKRIRNDLER